LGIKFELSYTKYPNRPIKNIALDWEGVVKEIYFRSAFGEQLKKKNHFKEELSGKIRITSRKIRITRKK